MGKIAEGGAEQVGNAGLLCSCWLAQDLGSQKSRSQSHLGGEGPTEKQEFLNAAESDGHVELLTAWEDMKSTESENVPKRMSTKKSMENVFERNMVKGYTG